MTHPDAPWYADYPWDERGITDQALRKALNPFVGAVVFTVFAAPFHCLILTIRDMPGVFTIGVVVVYLIVAACIGQGIYRLLRYRKYGSTNLRFNRFPFFLGDKLEVEMSNPRGIGEFRSIEIALLCIEEQIVRRGTARNRTRSVVCYQIYGDTVRFEKGVYKKGGASVPITFLLPADASPTSLSASPPTYWEIEIKAETPGVDYNAVFLVPVYAKPQ